jgi:hypothetical protein
MHPAALAPARKARNGWHALASRRAPRHFPCCKPLVAYYRVSTREQGRSGLGIDAQRAAVARFAEAEGFEIIAEFTEIEARLEQ